MVAGVTDGDRIWLKALCAKLERGEPIDPVALRIELLDKLPPDFMSSRIDRRYGLEGEADASIRGHPWAWSGKEVSIMRMHLTKPPHWWLKVGR